jgi:RNA polymerase sigma-70 factor, ECF subfamily
MAGLPPPEDPHRVQTDRRIREEQDDGARDRFADLVLRIADRQDRGAFAELFAWFAPRVKAFMLRLGAVDSQAEELSQEVLLTVWRKAETYDPDQASVSTWIFRIARNRRIDVLRRTIKPELDPEDVMFQPAAMPAPDEGLTAMQRERCVREALDVIPDDQRRLLEAAFYEGLSHTEIAERWNLPLGTVKSRIRLAFQKLRERLDPDL